MTDDNSTIPGRKQSEELRDKQANHSAPARVVEFGNSPSPSNISDDATVRDTILGARIGTYQVETILGQGGFGSVYKAVDTMLCRPVALKVLRNQLDTKHRQLFEREARAIASLRHPNIVQIHQWGEYLQHSFFVLEYLPLSVADLIKGHREGIDWMSALPLAIQCADALSYAHDQGIIHRDIKPPNLLLETESGPIKLADFGLSRYSDSIDTTIAGTVSGSPPYMSPEQATAQPVDNRSDIFSLGVTLYEMLTGQRPFEGSTAGEIIRNIVENNAVPIRDRRADLPAGIIHAVEKALAHKRTDRYQSAAEFAQDLNEVLPESSRLQITHVTPPALRGNSGLVRPKRWHLIVSFAVLLIAVGGLWSIMTGGNKPSVALAHADMLLESGDAKAAEAAFITAMGQSPSDEADYGLGYSYLRQGLFEDAARAFGSVDKVALRTEGLSAVACEQLDAEQARASLADALQTAKTPYLQTLVGALDISASQYEQAADVLQRAQTGPFIYKWQEAECLLALGQAYFHLKKFDECARAFENLRSVSPNHAEVADGYLRIVNNAADDVRRQQVLKRAASIRQLIDSGVASPSIDDPWKSRPLTCIILPAEASGSIVVAERGLIDILPMLVGDSLSESTPMTLVDRELIQDILSEQEISSLLGSQTAQLRLGQVLGARLLIQVRVISIEGQESLRPYIVDTESTRQVSASMVPVRPQVGIQETAKAVADEIWSAVRKAYPLQGRLYAKDGRAEIDIGAGVGVVPGTRFEILMSPGQPSLKDRLAIVEDSIAQSSATVRLENLTPDSIPPEGWYVRSAWIEGQGGQ